jgi:hypothetical protein
MTVYLIHFNSRYKHAGHYIGFVAGGKAALAARMDLHRTGRGANLMGVITAAGIDWSVSRVWYGASRRDERRLKCQGAARYCPTCGGRAGRWLDERPRKEGAR